MSLKHGLLGMLSCEGPTTGYDLDKFFKSSLALFWSAKTSQIYRELSTMEGVGWLTSERVVQDDKPNKRVYSITEDGRAELVSWLTAADSGLRGSGMRSAFLMRLFFSGEIGKEQALKLLLEYRDTAEAFARGIEQAIKDIAADEADYPEHALYWKLAAMHGEMSYKAGLEWANKAIELLKKDEAFSPAAKTGK